MSDGAPKIAPVAGPIAEIAETPNYTLWQITAYALRLGPLGGDACLGPAPDASPTGAPVAVAAPLDPRWAALDDLSFDD